MRIDKIHGSRDNAQRVVTLTYNNVRVNKDGEWIGTPIRVERSVNDLVLVDNALNDSILGSRTPVMKKDKKEEQKERTPNDDETVEVSENMATNNREDPEPTVVVPVDDDENIEVSENMATNKGEDPEPTTAVPVDDDEVVEVSEKMATNNGEDPEPATVVHDDDGTINRNNDENTDAKNKMRRFSRKRIQKMTIESDDIGDCDTENDPDYKS